MLRTPTSDWYSTLGEMEHIILLLYYNNIPSVLLYLSRKKHKERFTRIIRIDIIYMCATIIAGLLC